MFLFYNKLSATSGTLQCSASPHLGFISVRKTSLNSDVIFTKIWWPRRDLNTRPFESTRLFISRTLHQTKLRGHKTPPTRLELVTSRYLHRDNSRALYRLSYEGIVTLKKRGVYKDFYITERWTKGKMITTILEALYYFLPAYFSNMAPVILGKINLFPQPVDLNKTWYGKPIFGANKTWGGLLYGTLLGTAIFLIQQKLYSYTLFQNLSIIDYVRQPLLLGLLLASGAILGDLAKSFVKRRLNKEPSAPWFPFDQLDFVIGAFIFSSVVYLPPWKIIVIIAVVSPFLHYATNYLGHRWGLKKVQW